MGLFLLRRTGAALAVLLLASILVFLSVRAIPGDPEIVLSGREANPAELGAIRHHYALDRPLPVQYARWLWRAAQGNFGTNRQGLPVGHTIVERLPRTLELAFLSLLVAVGVGVTAGVIAAARRGGASDYGATRA